MPPVSVRAAPGAATMPWRPGQNLGDDQNYDGLPDDEIRRAIREHLEADRTVYAPGVEVRVRDGRIRLAGWVSSEVEREMAERIVDDVIGLEVAANRLRVETVAREGVPRAARRRPVDDGELTDLTEDPREASDEGRPWLPPEDPWAEALGSIDPPHGVAIEDPRPPWEELGARPAQVNAAIARLLREAPSLGSPLLENATTFKDGAREVAGRPRRAPPIRP